MLVFLKSASAAAPRSNGFFPSSVIVPCDGGSSAPSMYKSELLPLPEGPVIAAASPGESVKLTPDSTVSGPRGVGYCLPTPETFNTADLWRDEPPTRTPRSDEPPTARSCSEHARRRTLDQPAWRTVRGRTTVDGVPPSRLPRRRERPAAHRPSSRQPQ